MNKLDEFKYNVAGKNITVIGIGISNLPLIKYLVSLGANVTEEVQKIWGRIIPNLRSWA